MPQVDIVLDMVGGETRARSFNVVRPGGILVSVVSAAAPEEKYAATVRSVFFLVDVTTQRLEKLAALFDHGKLKTSVGTMLPLEQARKAHEMLGGAPHARGKIILRVAPLS